MLTAIGLCLAGLLALIVGAELLTRGGSTLAGRLGVPPIIVGLTIVAVGTSAPELAVGIDAAYKGNGALAVGNIAGTNTANILLILGMSALISPLALHLQTLKLDLPAMVFAAVALWALSLDGNLTPIEGGILVALGAFYTALVVRAARRESRAMRREFKEEYPVNQLTGRIRRDFLQPLAALTGGIIVIVFGADWLVDGAVSIARLWGVSDAFIGLTIVAIGTSSPEFVTTLISTLQNRRDIAIGNLLGSSVYNIVFILGATCLLSPDAIPVPRGLITLDIPVMALVALACIPVFISGRQVSRPEAAFFVGSYIVYLSYLVVART
jgi:cation:H+ antiporter